MAKPTQIEIYTTSFQYQDAEYSYDLVDSIRFYYVITRRRINFIPSGTDYKAELDIYVSTLTNPISIRTSSLMEVLVFGINRSETRADQVGTLYQQIAHPTYHFRLAKYLKKFEKEGFINYDHKKIFKNGTVSDGSREICLMNNTKLLKAPFELIQRTPNSLSKKLKEQLLGRQDFVISTQFDQDVLFTILERYFNLRWKRD